MHTVCITIPTYSFILNFKKWFFILISLVCSLFFGIGGKLFGEGASASRSLSKQYGTGIYRSPEVYNRQPRHHINWRKVDMYAVGVIFFELCWIVRRHERDKVSTTYRSNPHNSAWLIFYYRYWIVYFQSKQTKNEGGHQNLTQNTAEKPLNLSVDWHVMIPPKDQQLRNFLSQEESYRLTTGRSLREIQRKDRVSLKYTLKFVTIRGYSSSYINFC